MCHRAPRGSFRFLSITERTTASLQSLNPVIQCLLSSVDPLRHRSEPTFHTDFRIQRKRFFVNLDCLGVLAQVLVREPLYFQGSGSPSRILVGAKRPGTLDSIQDFNDALV